MTIPVFVRNTRRTAVPSAYHAGLVLDYFPEKDRSTLALDVNELVARAGVPPRRSIDFLLLAAAIYAADKKSLRARATDRWARAFEVSAPVSDVAAWERATPALSDALGFLTGDRWTFHWREEPTHLWTGEHHDGSRFDAVCLFSGGLDSLAGAIDLLEELPSSRVVLVGHHDSTLTQGTQGTLASALVDAYGPHRVALVRAFARPAGQRARQEVPLPTPTENTTRSRSVLFLALGLAAAAAQGPSIRLRAAENGFIALNVPLVAARLGSCSTRTMHPHFLDLVEDALITAGLATPIENPYATWTKGEVLTGSRNFDRLSHLAPASVSCARPEQGRYEGAAYGNCGYCFPCLIRRAAMHAAGLDVGDQYRRDVCQDLRLLVPGTTRRRDALAVFTALQSGTSGALVPLRSGPLGRDHTLSGLRHVYTRGLDELRALFEAKASPGIRRIAGL